VFYQRSGLLADAGDVDGAALLLRGTLQYHRRHHLLVRTGLTQGQSEINPFYDFSSFTIEKDHVRQSNNIVKLIINQDFTFDYSHRLQ
jgi:hypothetical protein